MISPFREKTIRFIKRIVFEKSLFIKIQSLYGIVRSKAKGIHAFKVGKGCASRLY